MKGIPAELLAGSKGVRLPPDAYRPAAGCSEAVFQQAVIDLAHSLGWEVATFRKVRVQRKDGSVYFETPAGADGKGFPDLELCRDRLVKAELKLDSKKDSRLGADQERWRDRYREAGVEWYCWRPSMWADIVATLAGGAADAAAARHGGG